MAEKKPTEKKFDPRVIRIANHIEKLRRDAGFTSYEQFAYAKELNRVQYWRMEKGTNFTIESLLKILDAHGMTMQDFFNGVDEHGKTK